MRSLAVLFCSYLLTTALVQAQLLADYHPLQCSGKIPEEFLLSSTAKYEEQLKKIDESAARFEKQAQARFYLESSFYVDALLLSGKILFNDPLSKYVNRVADEVLKDQPRLRRKLRFYVLKSPVVNAFATEGGSIFLHIGLLARLENEAQLAFVLCHEIVHYLRGHAIDSYVVAQYVEDERGAYRHASRYEKLLAKSLYSREQELQADQEGLLMYLETPYAKGEALKVIDMLSKTNMPYDSLSSSRPAFLNPYFSAATYASLGEPVVDGAASAGASPAADQLERKLPPQAAGGPPTAAPVTAAPAVSAHPSLQSRSELLAGMLDGLNPEGVEFTIARRHFLSCREMARFELCKLYLEQRAYGDALYQVQLLMPQYATESYLRSSVAKALYGMACYRLADRGYAHFLTYPTTGKKMWQQEAFLHGLSAVQMATIGLSYCVYLQQSQPNPQLALMVKDLTGKLLEKGPPPGSHAGQESWEQQLWQQLLADTLFRQMYQQCVEEKRVADSLQLQLHTLAGRRMANRQRRRLERRGYRLGIDTLVVFGPVYFRIDQRKKHENPLQFIASEQQQAQFYRLIRRSARRLGLQLYLLDSRSLREKDPAAHFNDIARLYAWHEELLRHEDLHMICSNYDEVLPLIERYGTPYFANMGAFSLRANYNVAKLLVTIPTLAAPPFWPIFVYLAVQPNEASFFYTWVYDLSTHSRVMHQYKRMKMKTNETLLENNIYYDLWQIHKQPDTKRRN